MSLLPQQRLVIASSLIERPGSGHRIDRMGQTPLYEQVREAVFTLIREKNLVPGDALPSEHELCRALEVSRTVVRQALGQLENQGIIDRVRGKGTFVAFPKVEESLLRTLVGLYEDAARRGGTVLSDVLDHQTLPADADVAEKLQLRPGEPVVRLERVRYVDDDPWSLSVAWMPHDVGAHTYSADMRSESLYQVLQKHGIVGVSGTRSVEAVVANKEAVHLLHVPRGSALLKLRSLRKNAGGRVIEYFVAFHRGDRSSFEFELAANETRACIVSHQGPD